MNLVGIEICWCI